MRQFTPSTSDIAWAESILRQYAHNEVWFWRHSGCVYHVNKETKTLSLLVRAHKIWSEGTHHYMATVFAALGWRVLIHQTAVYLKKDKYNLFLRSIEKDAKAENLAVVDYGAELVFRTRAKEILHFDVAIDSIMRRKRKPKQEDVSHDVPAAKAGVAEG